MMSVSSLITTEVPHPPRDGVVERRSHDGGDLAKHGINGRQHQREDTQEIPTSLLAS
jgi:hypothetical protein